MIRLEPPAYLPVQGGSFKPIYSGINSIIPARQSSIIPIYSSTKNLFRWAMSEPLGSAEKMTRSFE